MLGCLPGNIISETEEIALTHLLLYGYVWNCMRISKQPHYKKDTMKLEGIQNTAIIMIKRFKIEDLESHFRDEKIIFKLKERT